MQVRGNHEDRENLKISLEALVNSATRAREPQAKRDEKQRTVKMNGFWMAVWVLALPFYLEMLDFLF